MLADEYEALARTLENVEAAMKVLEDFDGDSDAADSTYEALREARRALRHGLSKCERLLDHD